MTKLTYKQSGYGHYILRISNGTDTHTMYTTDSQLIDNLTSDDEDKEAEGIAYAIKVVSADYYNQNGNQFNHN